MRVEILKKRFGNILREKRKEQGLSVRALGAKLGTSGMNVCSIEKGNTIPRMPLAFKMAEMLGFSIDEIGGL